MSLFKRLLVATTLLGGGLASADPKFEFGKADEVKDIKDVEWHAAAELGLIFTTGNSETTTATGGFKAARKTGNNKLALEGTAAYARSSVRVIADQNANGLIDNESEITTLRTVTAEAYAAKGRYDRFLTESNSLFAALLMSRDIPAGKDFVVGGQLGYSRQIHKSETAVAVAELGYDFSHETLVEGAELAIHSGRAFLGYKAEMTPGTNFDASAEVLTNFIGMDLPTGKDGGPGKDTRVNLRAAIAAKIGKNLAFQSSIEAKYDHRPAPLGIANLAPGFVPEATRLDTIMKATLIYSFF